MSKVNPVSTSASASSIDHKRAKRKTSRVRLPTPPPDPTIDDAKKKDAEFLEYLESLQRSPHPALSRSTSTFAPAIATEDAFDHLDKLYKLMEQMLTLREQNVQLHRRIMDLERLRKMQDMHRDLDVTDKLDDDDPDTAAPENFLYNILSKKIIKQKGPIRFSQSILRKSQRRNQSVSDVDGSFERRFSVTPSSVGDKQSKVSKWTKVKAAFKWEKASPTVSDAKSQDSGLGGMQPVNYELARYLRVPSTSEELGTSPADSGAAEISTPGTLSSASSAEDVHRHARRRTHEETSDDEQLFTFEYIPIAKDEPSTSSKGSAAESKNAHRTPWAKMKDIIQTQTRNSFKKKHRLSAKSDDFKVDESIGSDNEDVFEAEEPKSPILIVQTPEDINLENEALAFEHSIPIDILARYRVDADEEEKISKWDKVKKAFLTSPSISRNENSSPTNSDLPTIKREINPTKESDEKLHAEIQRNYQQLQKKLSLEFQEKLQEWERSKLSSPSTSVSSNTPMNLTPDESKDLAFKKKMEEWEKIKGQPKFQLQSEENLPPEFRKKLQEWNKLKKSSMKEDKQKKTHEWPRWKSVSGHCFEPGMESAQLSEDFIRKYESWKQIKAGGGTPTEEDSRASLKGNKTPSPRLIRKDGSGKKIKDQTDKELQWFEKELSKIEREKQRLERDRQKFLDREERLAKLRRSVVGGNKKEILVHTPSGYYRFEGISRKFTQKLYEWEKAQGIGPEDSTFALLKTSCIPQIRSKTDVASSSLMRSKSADSIMGPDIGSVCPLLSQQPSSLSLNDVENLEKEILVDSSSVQDINQSSDNMDSEEPEALLVEVEDVVEETAAPLENYLEKHFAIYQKQELPYMCEGESRAAPTIRRSESARAQPNYDLIEEIDRLLKILIEHENEIQCFERNKMQLEDDCEKLERKYEGQCSDSRLLRKKILLLQEANNNVASSISQEESQFTISRLSDILETIQDITLEAFSLADGIHNNMYARNKGARTFPFILDNLESLNSKVLDIRRNLSYICAASDMSILSWKKKMYGPMRKIPSQERRSSLYRKSRSKEDSQDSKNDSDEGYERRYEKSSPRSELSRQVEQGAIKKRLRYRQKGAHSKTLEESDDDDGNIPEQRKSKPRRLRSQNSTESQKSVIYVEKEKEENAEIIVDPVVVEKVVVPTKTTNFLNFEETVQSEAQDSPVTVFVKTTRKLFTPLVTSSIVHEEIKTAEIELPQPNVVHLPPLPASPTPQRKTLKDISPNIRLMMVRYNQKLTDEQGAPRSAGSSGSASPVAWRSPVLERRVKAQTERYQQELQKMSPLLGGRREVQKSASMGVMISGNKQFTVHPSPEASRGILKSSSAGVIQLKKEEIPAPIFKPIPEERKPVSSASSISTLSDVRSIKIQKAKEEFLNSSGPSAITPVIFRSQTDNLKYPAKNRLSQISVGSESSCNSSAYEGVLMKSASVGMISVDPETYKQFVPEVHADGYVSLPRANKKSKEGLLSNITSKFRKVKMRRHKEKMNTVSTLCRQSLFVDIQTDGSQETLSEEQQSKLSLPMGSSSAETSPSTSRAGSWIKKTKIFKK